MPANPQGPQARVIIGSPTARLTRALPLCSSLAHPLKPVPPFGLAPTGNHFEPVLIQMPKLRLLKSTVGIKIALVFPNGIEICVRRETLLPTM